MIERQQIKSIRDRFLEAVRPIAEEMGVAVTPGMCKYGPTGEIRLQISPINEDGTVETKEAQAFKQYARLEGLNPTDLGRTFRSQGKTFEIIGFKPRATKRPILCRCREDRKNYVFESRAIKLKLSA